MVYQCAYAHLHWGITIRKVSVHLAMNTVSTVQDLPTRTVHHVSMMRWRGRMEREYVYLHAPMDMNMTQKMKSVYSLGEEHS